jgi:hypothetical protein
MKLAFRPKRKVKSMAQNLSLIGVQPDELPWMRLLISLLRHSDPVVPELARQALLYLLETAGTYGISPTEETASDTCLDNRYDSGNNLVS